MAVTSARAMGGTKSDVSKLGGPVGVVLGTRSDISSLGGAMGVVLDTRRDISRWLWVWF